MTKRYCKGERFADLSFAGEVFERINLLQMPGTYCPGECAAPRQIPGRQTEKKQEDAVVWEKHSNIYRHNKRRTDNG